MMEVVLICIILAFAGFALFRLAAMVVGFKDDTMNLQI